MRFCRRNLAFCKLAIQSNLEYRFNYFIDALGQPILTCLVEVALWSSIFFTSNQTTINGYPLDSYLSYAIWSVFVARISVNWMYEFRMLDEVSSGSLNTILARPMSFFEYYLSQFMGYKLITTFFSFVIPIIVVTFFKLPTSWERFPWAFALIFFQLIFIHITSFIVANFAFYLTRAQSLTATKNLLFWLLSGELFPLDLLPPWSRDLLLHLPTASGVYIPVAFMTGRGDWGLLVTGFISTGIGIVFMATLAHFFWKASIRNYVGTGA